MLGSVYSFCLLGSSYSIFKLEGCCNCMPRRILSRIMARKTHMAATRSQNFARISPVCMVSDDQIKYKLTKVSLGKRLQFDLIGPRWIQRLAKKYIVIFISIPTSYICKITLRYTTNLVKNRVRPNMSIQVSWEFMAAVKFLS